MAVYNFEKNIDSGKLTREITSAGLSLSYINTSGVNVEIHTTADLETEQLAELTAIVEVHDPVDNLVSMTRRVLECKAFGESVMAEFAAENVLPVESGGLGLSSQEMVDLASKFANVQLLISSGSLKLARAAFAAATLTTGFDQARKDKYLAIIDAFLAT